MTTGSQNMNALLIEDDEGVVDIQTSLLRNAGYQVEHIDSKGKTVTKMVAEIRAQLQNATPALIVLDGCYEEGSAVDIIQHLGPNLAPIRVVVHTSSREILEGVKRTFGSHVFAAEKRNWDWIKEERLSALAPFGS